MADTPDIDQMAQQYLDLWQDHLKGMAADPKVGQTVAQLTQMMTGTGAAFAALAQQMSAAANAAQMANKESTADDRSETAGRAAPPAAAHGDPNFDLAQLARRLDDIERRLADLEAGTGEPGKGSGSTARRRRP